MAVRGVAGRAGVVVAALMGVCGPVSAQGPGGIGHTGPISISGPPAGGPTLNVGVTVNVDVGRVISPGNISLNGGGSVDITGSIGTAGSISARGGTALTAGANPSAAAPTVTAAMPQPRGVNPALGVAPAGAQHGSATVRDSGLVGVVGASAARSSVIMATLEKVTVGGADTLTVDLAGDGLLQLQVARPVLDIHGQALSAGRGTVALSASAARDVVSGVTNVQGHNAARSVTSQGGVIVFGR